MPAVSQSSQGIIVYQFPIGGLMGGDYKSKTAALTEHCTNGLNLWAGHRTPWWLDKWGNVLNGWDNAGGAQRVSYLSKLPLRTDVALVDSHGAPIRGATVDCSSITSPTHIAARIGLAPIERFRPTRRAWSRCLATSSTACPKRTSSRSPT